jgi:hypothetical protein
MADAKHAQGWQAHVREQRRRWLALSYVERLRWLEDAKRFHAMALGAARRVRKAAAAPSG